MSRSTPLRPAASYLSCASSKSPPLASLLLALAALAAPGCYSGSTVPEGAPWGGEEDDGAGSMGDDDGEADDGDSATSQGDGDGGDAGEDGPGDGGDGDDGATDGDGGDAGDDGPGDGGDAGDAGDAGDGGDPPPTDVPDIPYCDEVADWDPAWRQLEEDVLVLVNEARAAGANCGSQGSFGSAPPLTMNDALRCAARKHSKDMNDRSFFDHTNPSGESPWDRMGHAGYNYTAAGENIAGGSPDAAGTMNQWMTSDGHCSNIMNPDFEEIGVGYYPGGQWGHLWTQAFGAQ